MLFAIAAVAVVVLVGVALLPAKKRESQGPREPSPAQLPFLARKANLRQQQLQEEAEVIAGEYHARAEEAWLESVRSKAAELFGTPVISETVIPKAAPGENGRPKS